MKAFLILFLIFITPLFGECGCDKDKPLKQSDNLEIVACSNPLAEQVGRDVLANGGSAMDAAVAIQMVLNVVEPENSGIGGGSLIVHYQKGKKEITVYDGREAAPQWANKQDTIDDCGQAGHSNIPPVGGVSVAVPGTLKALELAHREHGKLSWSTLFQPAIEIAVGGFPLSQNLDRLIKEDAELPIYTNVEDFFFAGVKRDVQKSVLNPRLANIFHMIALQGADYFYKGPLAYRIVQVVRGSPRKPGGITATDLFLYEALKTSPIRFNYQQYEIAGAPPPSVGGIGLAQIFGILKHHQLQPYSLGSLEFINLFSQASQLAYADLSYFVADPEFFPVPVDALIDKDYLAKRAKLLNPHGCLKEIVEGEEPKKYIKKELPLVGCHKFNSEAMTHFCVADKNGNVVAMSSSLGRKFGSKLDVEGFFLNSSMADFCEPCAEDCAGTANCVKGGKRPLTYMSPTLVFDQNDRLILALGSAGGGSVVEYVAQGLFGKLTFKMDAQKAIDYPHYVAMTDKIFLERGTSLKKDVQTLKALGHRVFLKKLNSHTAGLEWGNQKWQAFIDARD